MPMNSSHQLKKPKKELDSKIIEFVAAGIACNALTVLDSVGLLQDLVNKGVIEEEEFRGNQLYANPILIQSAIKSLCASKILKKTGSFFRLTTFGKNLVKQLGMINLLYDSYSGLFAMQTKLAHDKSIPFHKAIDFKSMALASDQIASDLLLDPILINLFNQIKVSGTICDLGCGSGERLSNLCKELNVPGLGIEYCSESLKLAQNRFGDLPIQFEVGDVSELKGVWKDVQIVMQSFMTHDLFPASKCAPILKSYQLNFPNMKYLVILDVVSNDYSSEHHTPGFDYVHGLQGIETYNYGRVIEVYLQAGYEVENEFKIPILPNAYLWQLKPARNNV